LTLPAPTEAEPQSRRARKKQRTRTEIYSSALRLFARDGFDRVTVQQICEAADVARGTFFRHYPTKSALLFEFNRAIAIEFAARLVEPRGDAQSEFRALVHLLVERWLEQADVMRAMLRAFVAAPEPVPADEHDLAHVIADLVARGQERGELRNSIDPRLAAAVFLAGSTAILTGHVFQSDEIDAQTVRDQMIELVLYGLVQAPATRTGAPT